MKYCSKCKQNKQRSEFHKNRSKNDGLQDCCKSCDKIRLREYVKTTRGIIVRRKAVKKYQKGEIMKIEDKCEKKGHKWKKWRAYDSYRHEYRKCKRCGKRQNREVELITSP